MGGQRGRAGRGESGEVQLAASAGGGGGGAASSTTSTAVLRRLPRAAQRWPLALIPGACCWMATGLLLLAAAVHPYTEGLGRCHCSRTFCCRSAAAPRRLRRTARGRPSHA